MSFQWLGRRTRLALGLPGRTLIRTVVPLLEALEDRALPAPLTVIGLNDPAGAAGLAQMLAGQGVTISNVSFTGTTGGATASAGMFTGGTGVIGFESGVILSNGHAVDVEGGSKNFASTDLGLAGDTDLDNLANVSTSDGHDATILSFDFVPKGSTLQFSYVFGSEEYNEFVGSQFDDVFGFFLNGKNVAVIPGTNTPVSVNTVNKGINSKFYIDNDPQDFGGNDGPVQTALNGLTVVLTVNVSVMPGVTNHIKLGIEDTGDGAFDSDVFIAAGSFAAPPPGASPTPATPVAFKPFRYIFDPATSTYQGNVTIGNKGQLPLEGPITIALADLPPNVTLVNATGTVGGTNGSPVLPAITVSNVSSLNAPQVLRITVEFTDPPPPVPLSTFFEGYLVEVFTGTTTSS
jgi:hypothetical protein